MKEDDSGNPPATVVTDYTPLSSGCYTAIFQNWGWTYKGFQMPVVFRAKIIYEDGICACPNRQTGTFAITCEALSPDECEREIPLIKYRDKDLWPHHEIQKLYDKQQALIKADVR